ncbi:DNA polymerase [Thalassotalea insulae]|uniref:DNA polymerase n=1 Tax=Thalassotalea insulae TaxID=2056778 RepID=A0ABQ6GM97_9GAMM|nr:DNA polymerase II [Thalassotalea insulae]GLX76739.1 DNA polymerase [Thalassotalea insulae]
MEIPADKLLSGFLLTRQAFDTQQGICLSYWLKTEQGPANVLVTQQSTVFFVEATLQQQVTQYLNDHAISYEKITPLALKTFNQQSVCAIYFRSMRDYYRAKEILASYRIKCYEDDFRPEDRFLMERFVTAHCQFNVSEQAIMAENTSSHAAPRIYAQQCRPIPKTQIDSGFLLDMVSLDIECSMQGELYSIGLYSHALNGKSLTQVLMIGDNSNTKSKLPLIERQQIAPCIRWLEDEKALLVALIDWFKQHDPDVVIGWNVVQFDFNVLQKRCDLYQLLFSIGRDGKAPRWRKNNNSGQQYIDIAGRVVLDGIDLLKTATYNFPSFSLDYVATELLARGKKVEDVDNRVQEITDNFHHDKLALAAYNLEDCRLVTQIFEKTQLLEFAMLRAQLTGLTLDRIGGSVAAFTNLYLPKLHRAGYVAPNLGDGLKGLVSPGGYVMDSIPGLYQNVLVLDFKSLYPSIIRSFNIDPMGMIEGLKAPEDAIEGFDGAYFSRDKHFLPQIIKDLWQERDKAKQENNAALSQAIKIIMNSFYGVLGSTGCRFFDPRLSGSITKRGHQLLKQTQVWIEAKGYRVIYGDTDSIFVHVGNDKSAEQSRALGASLAEFINSQWQQKLEAEFHIKSELEIEFETHFSQFFMPTIRGLDVGTKKRYAGLVRENGDTQIIFKGLESVRTDWTELAKTFQRSLYLKVFNQEPVKEYVMQVVQDTYDGKLDDLLVYRKRIRKRLSEYVKNVPPHIKAARAADAINQQQGKPLKFQGKGWIEYYLTTAGPQAKGYVTAPLDYQLYIDKQIATVADAILPFINESFTAIVDQQQSLF